MFQNARTLISNPNGDIAYTAEEIREIINTTPSFERYQLAPTKNPLPSDQQTLLLPEASRNIRELLETKPRISLYYLCGIAPFLPARQKELFDLAVECIQHHLTQNTQKNNLLHSGDLTDLALTFKEQQSALAKFIINNFLTIIEKACPVHLMWELSQLVIILSKSDLKIQQLFLNHFTAILKKGTPFLLIQDLLKIKNTFPEKSAETITAMTTHFDDFLTNNRNKLNINMFYKLMEEFPEQKPEILSGMKKHFLKLLQVIEPTTSIQELHQLGKILPEMKTHIAAAMMKKLSGVFLEMHPVEMRENILCIAETSGENRQVIKFICEHFKLIFAKPDQNSLIYLTRYAECFPDSTATFISLLHKNIKLFIDNSADTSLLPEQLIELAIQHPDCQKQIMDLLTDKYENIFAKEHPDTIAGYLSEFSEALPEEKGQVGQLAKKHNIALPTSEETTASDLNSNMTSPAQALQSSSSLHGNRGQTAASWRDFVCFSRSSKVTPS
jgi:hypothetical protein